MGTIFVGDWKVLLEKIRNKKEKQMEMVRKSESNFKMIFFEKYSLLVTFTQNFEIGYKMTKGNLPRKKYQVKKTIRKMKIEGAKWNEMSPKSKWIEIKAGTAAIAWAEHQPGKFSKSSEDIDNFKKELRKVNK